MQIAQIGPWEFEMPDGLTHKVNESSSSYFEDEEGTTGLYVKAIELAEPKASSSHLANYIQDVHLRGFTDGATDTWQVVDKRLSINGELARSALDLYDESANYRVLSLVVATADTAVQVTVHDYWCENYCATQARFSNLEASIVQVTSAA
jgi:hypothetical protein